MSDGAQREGRRGAQEHLQTTGRRGRPASGDRLGKAGPDCSGHRLAHHRPRASLWLSPSGSPTASVLTMISHSLPLGTHLVLCRHSLVFKGLNSSQASLSQQRSGGGGQIPPPFQFLPGAVLHGSLEGAQLNNRHFDWLLSLSVSLSLLLPGCHPKLPMHQALASGSASRGAWAQMGCKRPAEESELCPVDKANQMVSRMKTTARATL